MYTSISVLSGLFQTSFFHNIRTLKQVLQISVHVLNCIKNRTLKQLLQISVHVLNCIKNRTLQQIDYINVHVRDCIKNSTKTTNSNQRTYACDCCSQYMYMYTTGKCADQKCVKIYRHLNETLAPTACTYCTVGK